MLTALILVTMPTTLSTPALELMETAAPTFVVKFLIPRATTSLPTTVVESKLGGEHLAGL